jgi:hypothetical protein
MNDFATPLDSLRNRIYHRSHHPSRWLVFSIGLMVGILLAVIGAWTYEHRSPVITAPVPVWGTESLVCAGYDGTAFYVHNTTHQDIRLEPDSVILLDRHELGLSLSASRLTESIFIPAHEAVSLPISPEPTTDLVLFDKVLKLRIDLSK